MADKPVTREEKYLAYLTGDYTGELPKPITRKEKYLYELCLKGIGGEISPEEIKAAVNEYLEKNPVKPGATTEQAQQIEQNKTDIASLKSETGSLKEDISTKITKFYASNQGETHLADSDNGKIMDMMLYGRSEQKQYRGKNLLPTTMYSDSNVTNGVTFTNNGDGSVTASGTATDITYFKLWGYNVLGDKGVLPGITPGDVLYVSDCLLQQTNSKEITNIISNGSTQFKDSTTTTYAAIRVNKGKTVNKTFYPQIEKGSEATSYEPYVGGQPSPSPDYPQEIKSVVNPTVKVSNKDGTQSETVTLPYTLNAIPVSSGGNVTIDGQQYIADYVDVERGKLVQRIWRGDFDGNANERWTTNSKYERFSITIDKLGSNYSHVEKSVYCNRYQYNSNVFLDANRENGIVRYGKKLLFRDSNITNFSESGIRLYLAEHPLIIITYLDKPIEIDLTQEEVSIFKKLATYYPITNISVTSEQLDGYTIFNYPISMANGWNYVKQQLNDNRDYIYDMDLQSAVAYVNSEYAVALTELEV